MSLRSIILGFIGAALLCGMAFFNDMVMQGTFLVGHFIPISLISTLLLFVLFINPLLFLLNRRLAFSGKELAVIFSLTLFSCSACANMARIVHHPAQITGARL